MTPGDIIYKNHLLWLIEELNYQICNTEIKIREMQDKDKEDSFRRHIGCDSSYIGINEIGMKYKSLEALIDAKEKYESELNKLNDTRTNR